MIIRFYWNDEAKAIIDPEVCKIYKIRTVLETLTMTNMSSGRIYRCKCSQGGWKEGHGHR